MLTRLDASSPAAQSGETGDLDSSGSDSCGVLGTAPDETIACPICTVR